MKWKRHDKFETRNPKSERRSKPEVRRRKPTPGGISTIRASFFGFRISGFFRPSAFGLRIYRHMRLGTVIGRVTLSATVPSLTGARWLIVSPFTREHFQRG